MGCCSGHLVMARLMKRYRRLAKLCIHAHARLTKIQHSCINGGTLHVCCLVRVHVCTRAVYKHAKRGRMGIRGASALNSDRARVQTREDLAMDDAQCLFAYTLGPACPTYHHGWLLCITCGTSSLHFPVT